MSTENPNNTPSNKKFLIVGITLVIIFSLFIAGILFWALRNENQTNNNPFAVNAFAYESFDSCTDLKNKIDEYYERESENRERYPILPNFGNPVPEDAISTRSGGDNEIASNRDFSGTNNQVSEVDEGDIIKTNGEYIFSLNNAKIHITKVANGGQLSTWSRDFEGIDTGFNTTKINLYENKIIFIGSQPGLNFNQTKVLVYEFKPELLDTDVNQALNPIQDFGLPGYNIETRMVNSKVYLVNNYFPGFLEDLSLEKIESSIQNISFGNNQINIPCEKINYISPISDPNSFVTLVALDVNNLETEPEYEVVMGSSNNIYSSKDNLYIAQSIYNYSYIEDQNSGALNETGIFKFNLGDNISFQTSTIVPGRPVNQFAMDEYNQVFRIATTVDNIQQDENCPRRRGDMPMMDGFINPCFQTTTQTNSLYTYDSKLNKLGQVVGLAEDERIYSVRFLGDRGFFVTFRETDPLYTFDLSDPANPKVTGELKIPGFSNYLHPISEDLLIGIGQDADESNGRVRGLKLSLFDISGDEATELDNVIIGNRGTFSEVSNDHKAFLWDARNNSLALPVNLVTDDSSENNFQGSYVYKIENNKFSILGRITHQDQKLTQETTQQTLDEFGQVVPGESASRLVPVPDGSAEAYIRRQLYIDDYLITYSPRFIKSNEISNLTNVDVVELR